MESILTSIKKLLGIADDDENFDVDIIIHINTVFSDLKRLGVGPATGFRIEGEEETWNDYIPSDDENIAFEDVKTYTYLRVKLVFDPPLSSTTVQSMEKQIQKFEWNLNVDAETP